MLIVVIACAAFGATFAGGIFALRLKDRELLDRIDLAVKVRDLLGRDRRGSLIGIRFPMGCRFVSEARIALGRHSYARMLRQPPIELRSTD